MPPSGHNTVVVLVVGNEPSLRETYSLLFQRAGYGADCVEVHDCESALSNGKFGLVVIDHTLSKPDRKSLVKTVRRIAPAARVVAFHSSAQDCGADLTMDSREGAAAILERVAELLNGGVNTAQH
jgi:DNA-binding NtrC family response regulator